MSIAFWKERSDIQHKTLLELDSIANSLSKEDRDLLLNTMALKFNELYENPEPDTNEGDEPPF